MTKPIVHNLMSQAIAPSIDRIDRALIELGCIAEIMTVLADSHIDGTNPIEGPWVRWLARQVDRVTDNVRAGKEEIEESHGKRKLEDEGLPF